MILILWYFLAQFDFDFKNIVNQCILQDNFISDIFRVIIIYILSVIKYYLYKKY